MRYRLIKRAVILGKYYRIGNSSRKYLCVLASPKGINFLNEDTFRMRFKRSFYASTWSNKIIPKNQKDFTITTVDF